MKMKWSFSMLSQCANPTCTARLKYLHTGRIFVVRTRSAERYWIGDAGSFGSPPGKQIECFWLCENCARGMRISRDGDLISANYSPKAVSETTFFNGSQSNEPSARL
jgi:hypothetical protein